MDYPWKVKISHECPLNLMDKLTEWNDYDYALVHLFEEYPKYFDFMSKQVAGGRHVLLDNSIFELGEAFDWDRYIYWLLKLCPTEYIIPDSLENTNLTIENFDKWERKYKNRVPVDTTSIGVVQGKTYEELVYCYNAMALRADKIAISFDYSFYLSIGLGRNKWEQFMDGRKRFIDMLIADGFWRFDKKHHLLGCALPQEFQSYDWEYLNIETLDTSNPVQQALLGQIYTESGLRTKESAKLVDSTFNRETFTEEEHGRISYNCNMFKRLARGNVNNESA